MPIKELYTDKIETFGTAKRVFFHFLHQSDLTGVRGWYYFGTTAAQVPPTTADPVRKAVTYVQFPQAFDDLGAEANEAIWDTALRAGRIRQGLLNAQRVNIFTGTLETQGATKITTFFMWADGTWYYFGIASSVPRPDPGLAGPIVAVADIRFPRDFPVLGAEESEVLYDLGLRAGMVREAIT